MTVQRRTGDQVLVREMNLSVVLNALREHSPLSRASLAAITGLNKTTVSSLIRQLVDAGFVSELGAGKTEEVGRPGILLELDPHGGRIIGVELGVGFISVVLTDFSAQIVWRRLEETSPNASPELVLRRTIEIIRESISSTDRDYSGVLGLGLGVPGLVDVSSGTLLFAPNLGWRDVPIQRLLEEVLDLPIYVDNEANMAALGESYFGVASGARSVLYVSAGVGLGGGIVLEGQLMPGATGFTGEVGHMTMVPDGLPCNCGNHGCWETLVSQTALLRRVRLSIEAGRDSMLRNLNLDALTVATVVEAARAGDDVAIRALHDTGVDLGVGIANLVNVLNPEVVVFGGILSLASDFLMPVVRHVIRERALRWSVDPLSVRVAAHGSDSAVMGGVATVYDRVLSEPSESIRKAERVRVRESKDVVPR